MVGAWWTTVCSFLQLILPAPVYHGGTHSGRNVLLVHGIHDSARSMTWMKRMLTARGWNVYTINLEPNNASVSFDVMGRQVKDFIETNFPAGEKIDLVGFSMGGLVSRYYIQKLAGAMAAAIRRLVSISAPNHGTIWAMLSGRAGVRQMRPGSEMLRELNANAAELEPLGYTSIYTPFDLTIVPPASSRMPVGRNVIAWVPLHPLMVILPSSMRAVEKALEN